MALYKCILLLLLPNCTYINCTQLHVLCKFKGKYILCTVQYRYLLYVCMPNVNLCTDISGVP